MSGPNNLEVNWLGHSFHLEQLANALCFDDGSKNEPPPKSNGNPNSRKPTLDVYYGEGWGRFNGECGAHAEWVMDDNGEPGKIDQIVALVITENGGGGPGTGDVVLNINPQLLGIQDTSISGNWTGSVDDSDDPAITSWLDLQTGNHQWTPHPFKSHGPTGPQPCPLVP